MFPKGAKKENAMENNKTTEPKAFNRALCFTFFGNWYEAITNLETDADKDSAAHTLFKAIAEYSLYGVRPDSENVVFKVIWPILETEIDNTIDRRRRRFAPGELSAKHKNVLELHHSRPELSYRDMEQLTGVPKSTIARLIERYGANYCVCDSDSHSDCSGADDTDCSDEYSPNDFPSPYSAGDTSFSGTGQLDDEQYCDGELPF